MSAVTISFAVLTLPAPELDPSYKSTSEEHRRAVGDEVKRIRAEAQHAITERYGADVPCFEYATLGITLMHHRGGPVAYRPQTLDKLIGPIILPIFQVVVDAGMVPNAKAIRALGLNIETRSEQEGYFVTLERAYG